MVAKSDSTVRANWNVAQHRERRDLCPHLFCFRGDVGAQNCIECSNREAGKTAITSGICRRIGDEGDETISSSG